MRKVVRVGKDACVTPVLELNEVDQHPYNKERGLLISIDGVLQPILVRRAGARYQVVAGERRLRPYPTTAAFSTASCLRRTSQRWRWMRTRGIVPGPLRRGTTGGN